MPSAQEKDECLETDVLTALIWSHTVQPRVSAPKAAFRNPTVMRWHVLLQVASSSASHTTLSRHQGSVTQLVERTQSWFLPHGSQSKFHKSQERRVPGRLLSLPHRGQQEDEEAGLPWPCTRTEKL